MDKGISLVAGMEGIVCGSDGGDGGGGTRLKHLRVDGSGTELGCFGAGGSDTERAGSVSGGDDRAGLRWWSIGVADHTLH